MIRGEEGIPESAAGIYAKHETLRKFTANLDLTVAWYNKVRETVLEVEFPLVESQLAGIDQQLQKAEKDLSWEGDGVWEYIQETRDQVRDLEKRVQKTKDNVDQIKKIMEDWSKTPLYERKELKDIALLALDDREERLNKRYGEITSTGEKIHSLVKVSCRASGCCVGPSYIGLLKADYISLLMFAVGK